MIFTIPIHELREQNDCHNPAGPGGGQFCSKGGGITRVGITSARPDRKGKIVFDHMRAFEAELRTLPGVRSVTVQPGLGAWEGNSEQTWVVSYLGNGEATKLLARTGRKYEQDAVLMMKGCKGPDCSPAVELVFDTAMGKAERDAVHDVLTSFKRADGSLIIGGWTWYKRAGKAMLRAVAVPQWGGSRDEHLATMQQVERILTRAGLTHNVRRKKVSVTVMDQNDHPYEQFM